MGRYWGAGCSLGAVIISCVVNGIQLGWVAWLWVSVFDVFWVFFELFSVGILASGFHCVCVRAWLGAFGVSTGEKKYFNKCERM